MKSMPYKMLLIIAILVTTIEFSPVASGTNLRQDVQYKHFTVVKGAIEKSDKEQIGKMLVEGLDPNIKDENGWSLLMLAARKGDIEVVRKLLDSGADINYQSENGLSPLLVGAFFGQTEAVNLLLSKGADKGAHIKPEGETALICAAMSGYLDVVKVLISHGADIHVKMKSGVLPTGFLK